MTLGRRDPGECIVCGAAHSTCGDGGPITVASTPMKDAAEARARRPLLAERVQATLPPGQFTTGTYRRRRRAATKGGDDT